MPNGFGFRGGWGFGFRGASPPWPYVGMGRGGLPRCWYYLGSGGATEAGARSWPPYGYYRGPWDVPQAAPPPPAPFGSWMAKEQELEFLKSEADAMAEYLKEIEARIQDLTSEEGQSD